MKRRWVIIVCVLVSCIVLALPLRWLWHRSALWKVDWLNLPQDAKALVCHRSHFWHSPNYYLRIEWPGEPEAVFKDIAKMLADKGWRKHWTGRESDPTENIVSKKYVDEWFAPKIVSPPEIGGFTIYREKHYGSESGSVFVYVWPRGNKSLVQIIRYESTWFDVFVPFDPSETDPSF